MDFADRIVLTLADPATRSTLFDQDALAAIVASGYDVASMAAAGPYAATFDDLDLAPDLSTGPVVDGAWVAIEGMLRTDARFTISNLPDAQAPLAAAVWSGAISATATLGDAHVSAVNQTWSGSGATYTDAAVVTYDPPAAAAPAAVTFAILAAVFIVDASPSIVKLLQDSAKARARLAATRPQPVPPGLRLTALPTVVWIVNQVVFDDDAWPGATAGMSADQARIARRTRAESWLAAQHIALALAA